MRSPLIEQILYCAASYTNALVRQHQPGVMFVSEGLVKQRRTGVCFGLFYFCLYRESSGVPIAMPIRVTSSVVRAVGMIRPEPLLT